MALGTAGALAAVPTTDVTYLLHVAGRVLDGARLGADVGEVSPPVIVWLKLAVVAPARLVEADPWLLWVAMTAALAVASLVGSSALLRRVPSLAGATGPVVAALAIAFFLFPGIQFGQREHLAFILTAPWLFASAALAEGAAVPARARWAASLAGGLGLAIKPYFGIVWLAVSVALLWSRRPRALGVPEVIGSAIVPALAVVVTVLLHPEWLDFARLYGPLYQHFHWMSPQWIAVYGSGAAWSWLGFGFLGVAFVGSRPWPRALTVLAAGQAGFHLAAALQMKGWSYHLLPAGGLAIVALATVATSGGQGWRGPRAILRLVGLGAALGVLAAGWPGTTRALGLLVRPGTKWAERPESFHALREAVDRTGRRETLLLLSTDISVGFPLVHVTGAEWTLRHPSFWALGAVYAKELRGSGMVLQRPMAEWNEAERRMVRELGEDIARHPPTIVVLPAPRPDLPRWATAHHLDYRPYLEAAADGRLRECLRIEPVSVEDYLMWRCAPAELR